jgi:hypothetical protein
MKAEEADQIIAGVKAGVEEVKKTHFSRHFRKKNPLPVACSHQGACIVTGCWDKVTCGRCKMIRAREQRKKKRR